MSKPKRRKLAQQPSAADVRQRLRPVWKREPVVVGKGDAGSCRRGRVVVLEREDVARGSSSTAAERPEINRRLLTAGWRNSMELFVDELGDRSA